MASLPKYAMNLQSITGIHIEPTNICVLRCSGCPRTRFLAQWPNHWHNHNLSIDALDQFLDIDLSNLVLSFCGNYGDPIYHPDFIPMIARFKQRGATVSITTNGSYKKPHWWQQLCSHLDAQDKIRFSIDGLPDSFTQYRENADWQSIESGIRTCVASSIRTVWKFIPFAFNQQEIDIARELSQSLGMADFVIDASDRFDEKTMHLIPVQDLVGVRKKYQDHFKNHHVQAVDPKCKNGRQHFISANGHYSPCCYVADHRFYYKTRFGKEQQQYAIDATRLSLLLQTAHTQQFFAQLDQDPPRVCQFNCPKI